MEKTKPIATFTELTKQTKNNASEFTEVVIKFFL